MFSAHDLVKDVPVSGRLSGIHKLEKVKIHWFSPSTRDRDLPQRGDGMYALHSAELKYPGILHLFGFE